MSFLLKIILNCTILLSIGFIATAQIKTPPTYVDAKGVFRWSKDKSPIYLFGVNYTIPFAYGYRSVKSLNLNIEKEIDKDVYHLARMGVDAFRVHVWDTEISDSLGNLKENEHLRLFDYLVSKLEERNMRIIITPIAFWGNGYPEKDEHTGSFSDKYGKNGALVNEKAFKAQERYLQQFFKHVNCYTKKTYTADDFVIATEINNEPHHSGPKLRATEYINRMKAAINSTGWNKPVFYNISESPWYADAVAKSKADGFSFQWYPIGLVAGHEQKGNFLPNIDKYTFPFDTIPEFKNKARIIYEFDAADLLQSYLYPAVARSFKQAGFQWVTQFAYDPLATAYGNTEYQTHYLNLAYTPAKAISFLIANRAFHMLPAGKSYGGYPADSVFEAYQVSYKQGMSQMNTAKEFYYSGTTATGPVYGKKLAHIAGVGSSGIIKYDGYGAYFLDKLESGIWRLEVMPDAIVMRDPFERPSPLREAVHIEWHTQFMQIKLEDIGDTFQIKGINTGNTNLTTANGGRFLVSPGTYIITKKGISLGKQFNTAKINNTIGLYEFVAPQPLSHETNLTHTPPAEITAGKPYTVNVKVINLDSTAKVSLHVNQYIGRPLSIEMKKVTPYDYTAIIPATAVVTGHLQYHIIVDKGSGNYIVYPGAHQGDPQKWDYLNNDYWKTYIAAAKGYITLFNPLTDQAAVNPYFPNYNRNAGLRWVSGYGTGNIISRMVAPALGNDEVMGLQLYIGDKLKSRLTEISGFTKLVIRARVTNGDSAKIRLALTQTDASCYAAYTHLNAECKTIEIPLSQLKPDSSLILPRPYPGFLPLWFKVSSFMGFKIADADKLEITASHLAMGTDKKPLTVDIESVSLQY
ncbi:cellulase family glycosylhydrolase [Mucilaginibacter terrae]|uniref:cellulase family glycosylhydrolase n=1 Tax=Mucilaginibacter terrae TaxID=1955052 RepID=UPI003625A14B